MAQPDMTVQLDGLQTETRNANSVDIDHLTTLELCSVLSNEDSTVHTAVASCLPVIAQVIDGVSERMRNGGRLFYIGAGTSGRLGVLDASEIPPTYSAAPGQFVALIAGGDHALRHAMEGAEDDRQAAAVDLEALKINSKVDSLIGIAASGRTPYVLGGLAYARALGCTTIGLVCVSPSEVWAEGNADHLIAAVTGPEVVTGSTRMKAGTATKMVLNMISTGIMIRLGKTYGNLMVDLRATNLKLRQRARNVIRAVAGKSCQASDAELDHLLEACGGSVKVACASLTLGLEPDAARERLDKHNGVLARAVEDAEHGREPSPQDEMLVLCVDAGGSRCKAVIMSADGKTGTGSAGPCNASTIGIGPVIASITSAVTAALAAHPSAQGRTLRATTFASAWVGIAGYDRPLIRPQINEALSSLLKLPIGDGLTVSADIDLLPASISSRPDIDSVVVLVAGTGSVAMRYQRQGKDFVRTGRAGGWGYLLGDDGSGYALGREATRVALLASDMCQPVKSELESPPSFSPLAMAVLKHVQHLNPACTPDDILSGVLDLSRAAEGTHRAGASPASVVAQFAEVLFSVADSDSEAESILDAGASSLCKLVATVAQGGELDVSKTALVLGGGLMQNDLYRVKVLENVRQSLGDFAHVEPVSQPVLAGAMQLLMRSKAAMNSKHWSSSSSTTGSHAR